MKPPEPSRGLERLWYGHSPLVLLLQPLAWLFGLATAARRTAYRAGLIASVRAPVPVIVVGNITVGGTGKTPVVAWLAGMLRDAGHRPGIISRGYGGSGHSAPRLVRPDDTATEVGDEPLLLARDTGVPVCVCTERVAAARFLAGQGVTILIADDGLQHYRLARDIEIAVLDGERRLGNGYLLPAGPLREPPGRLASVDFILVNGQPAGGREIGFHLLQGPAQPLGGGAPRPLQSFAGAPVRALAGIGNPGRFLRQLKSQGLAATPVPVPDHGRVDLPGLFAHDPTPVLMTGKDAVKYGPLPGCDVWVVPVEVEMPYDVGPRILAMLATTANARTAP